MTKKTQTAPVFALVAMLTCALVATANAAEKAEPESADVASISLKSIDGEDLAPLKCAEKQKAAVIIFITTDCPIANSFAPEINRLHLAYASRGVCLTLVHVDADLSDEKAREHATEYELKPDIVVDREHALVKAANAKVTPEAFVYDATGKLRYRGRINNLYAALGQRRANVTVHDLRDALEAVISDREVVTTETEALGCFIERK